MNESFPMPEFLYDLLTEDQIVRVRKCLAARWAAGYTYALGKTDQNGVVHTIPTCNCPAGPHVCGLPEYLEGE